jgi:D-alanyl-D-alanine-carboxypeptidase/D-alanyl-D-alanine-endopeptidase
MTAPHRRLLGVALLAGLTILVPANVGAQHFPADEDLQTMLRYLVKDGETPGIVLGVLEADGSTRIVSYGSAGPDARPLGPRSVFEIGSITKTFTATLLADMVARGEISREDFVSAYLPDRVNVPSRSGREITLLDLATHRSGLPRNLEDYRPADQRNPNSDFTIERLYAFLSSHELARDPGAEFEYSNLGMGLLAHGLALAAGRTFQDLLEERVLEPLGMNLSGFAIEGERADWMTLGHAGGVVVPYRPRTEPSEGAGGILSNVEDMLTYLKANVGPPETELEQAMQAAQEVRRPWGAGGSWIGLAWNNDSIEGRHIVAHGGNTAGFSSLIAFDPERRVGIVMLTNTALYSDDTPMKLLTNGPPLNMPEALMSREALGPFVGEYTVTSERSVHVRLEDEGYLTYQLPGRARVPLFAESESSFLLKKEPLRFTFQKKNGEVVGLVMERLTAGIQESAQKTRADSPPPAVVAGNDSEWVEGEWLIVASILMGGLALLTLLTLGAELRRVFGTRRGS